MKIEEKMDWDKLRLASDVRLLSQPDGGLRLRKGVWNFEEAVVSGGKPEEKRAAALVVELCQLLADGKSLSPQLQQDFSQEKQALEMVQQLLQAGYLQQQAQERVERLLLGLAARSQWSPPAGQVLLLCDQAEVSDRMLQQAQLFELPLCCANPALVQALSARDLSAAVDGFETEALLQQLELELSPFWAVVVLQQQLNVILLRNLNLLLLRRKKAAHLILGYLDGPFTGLSVLKPGESACFGCLEYRVMARLQDHRLYQSFVSCPPVPQTYPLPYAPLLQWQADLALGELLTLVRCGMVKLLGRILNFYLPSYELQYQEVLRSAQCPACGYAMRSQLHELNVRADLLLEELRRG